MDPNLLRHIEYFLEPNGQTGDLDSQQQQRRLNTAAASSSSGSAPNFWEIAGLNGDSGLGSPSSPASLSFDSFGPSANAKSQPQQQPRTVTSGADTSSRVILPPRPPRSKAGHERKRTKLSTESTPFDNVDYWIQFDNEEDVEAEAGGSGLTHQKSKAAQPHHRPSQPSRHHSHQQQRPKRQHSHVSHTSAPAAEGNPHQHHQQQQQPPQRNLQEQREQGVRSVIAAPSNPRTVHHRSMRTEDLAFDDSALDYALSEEGDMTAENFGTMNLAEQLSQIDSMPPSEVPPREGLYSTPLSWEKPQPGLRLDSFMGMQNPQQQLSEEEQRRLIAIAMNAPVMGGLGQFGGGQATGSRGYVAGGGLHATLGPGISLGALGAFGGLGNLNGLNGLNGIGGLGGLGALGSLAMGQITDDAPLLRPETPAVAKPPQPPPSRLSRTNTAKSGTSSVKGKGKEKEEEGERDPKGKGKSTDRTAHNDIERKYRTNLKDRIAELRDAVPALRTIQEGVVDDGEEGSAGNRPKVSKGAVLTKATEYINYLEKKNKAIMAQHQQLSRRLAAFEQLLAQTARPSFQMPNYSRTLFDPRAFC